jgi:hypothetical protein
MRRSIALAALLLAAPFAAQAAGLTVPIDQSRRLPVAGAAASIVIGNTAIADVRPVDSRTLMVIGKKQGVTNVVVLDEGGRTLYDGEVTVSAGPGSVVTVFRGVEASEYACSPFCQSSSGSDQAFAAASPITAAPVAAAAPVAVPLEAAPTGAK